MSIPPALLKPQLMKRDASPVLETKTDPASKSPKTIKHTSFHLKILQTVCGSLLLFLVFGEDEADRLRRLSNIAGASDIAIALNRPLPWNDPGYNLKQPTGDQILKPLKVRPLEFARALKKRGARSPLHRSASLKPSKKSSSKSEFKAIVTTPPTPFNHD